MTVSAATINGIDPVCKDYYSGTHRIVPPDSTFERVAPFFTSLGITRVANITGLDRIGIPVAMVCRPNARSLSVSQGKGLDLISAKVSGVMESVEGYHSEHICLPLKLGSYEELRSTHTLPDPKTLPQSKNDRWHPHLQLLWIEGFDLMEHRSVWVPFELTHLNAALDGLPGEGAFIAGSSGLASGNHLLEAVSHGICELVERDALALWRLREDAPTTRVDISSVDDPDCVWLLQKFDAAKITVGLWSISSDIGVASFLCCGLDETREEFHPMPVAVGSGSHPSRAVALSRALTEAAQCRATLIAGSREDLSAADYQRLFSAQAQEPWRRLLRSPPTLKFCQVPDFLSDNLVNDVDYELRCLERCGLKEVVVVDLTRPELGIPVVRVIVPGLEPDNSNRRLGLRSQAILSAETTA